VNNLVKSGAGPVPALSQSLAQQVDALIRGESVFRGSDPDDVGIRMAAPEPVYHPEAPAAAVAYGRLCVPVTRHRVEWWVRKLAAGVLKAPEGDGLDGFIDAAHSSCASIPDIIWNQETADEMLRCQKWWPSPAEIHELLKPYADKLLGTRDALDRISRAARVKADVNPPKPREPVTDAVREHVRVLAAAFEAERSWNQTSPETGERVKPVVKTSYLTDEQMLASCELLAKAAPTELRASYALRAARLRERIGKSYRERLEDGE
jgi:hypothetical protein